MSVAARVAQEMSVKLGNEVSLVYYHHDIMSFSLYCNKSVINSKTDGFNLRSEQ